MKKLVVCILTFTLAFCLAACGEKAATVTNVYVQGATVESSDYGGTPVISINSGTLTVLSDNTYIYTTTSATAYGSAEQVLGSSQLTYFGVFETAPGGENEVIYKLGTPTRIISGANKDFLGNAEIIDTDNADTYTQNQETFQALSKEEQFDALYTGSFNLTVNTVNGFVTAVERINK